MLDNGSIKWYIIPRGFDILVLEKGGFVLVNRIKEIATQKGISIPSLIKSTKLSKSYVYDIVNGKSSPTIPVAQKIAEALGVSLDEVFPMVPYEKEAGPYD